MENFGLLGEHLSHSYSPQIHSLLGDYPYRLYEVRPEGLADFLRHGDWQGCNVTIPYKQAVLPYCAELSAPARQTGSVNTLLRQPDGSLFGDNTDTYGFRHLVQASGGADNHLSGRKALVLGSGGASRSVAAVLAEQGAAPVVIISRSGADNYLNIGRHSDASLIVNATPVGMYPDNGRSPLDLNRFAALELVLDLIYNPAKSELLFQAEELGIKFANGLAMLVSQAKAASELFQGCRVDESRIGGITALMARQMMNVVLLGMPGSGKTTVGRRLAALTNRAFYDTDELVAAEAGKSIAEIFASEGEDAFRERESEVLSRVSRLSSCVIACGGGVVTRGRNKKLIRQNSQVVLLERNLEDLPTIGRPLSQARPLSDLYQERMPLYRAWSDYTFTCLSVTDTAKSIKEELRL
jgi:shikimate dehydrogenase